MIINKLRKLIEHNSRKTVKADETIQLHYYVNFIFLPEIKPNKQQQQQNKAIQIGS